MTTAAATTLLRWRRWVPGGGLRPRTLLAALVVMTILAVLLSLQVGPADVGILQAVARSTSANEAELARIVIFELRFPRTLVAVATGASLALAGATMQGLFRNPLADPGLLDVSSGAALGAVSVIVLGGLLPLAWMGAWLLPGAAFLGALAGMSLAYALAQRQGQADVALLLLAGIAVNAIAGAGIGMLTYISTDEQLRSLTFWSMGSVAQAEWSQLLPAVGIMAASTLLLCRSGHWLNLLLLGERAARHAGLPVASVKRLLVVLVALQVGAAVAITGVIGFVGLVVPHMVRLLIGPDHRMLLPASIFGGAVLLLTADLVARSIVAPAELPIGLVTTLIGGPFFLLLLLQRRQRSAFG